MNISDRRELLELPAFLTTLSVTGGRESLDSEHLELPLYLAAAFQFREKGVVGHLRRVSAYVEILARNLRLPEVEVQRLKYACVFHDVGMVDVPEEVLKKQGSLTKEETMLLRRHTELGRDLLQQSSVPFLMHAGMLAWCHHERFDGTGYPRRLAVEEIPLGARILSIADVFDALTTARPFKGAYPVGVVVEMIRAKAGTHFDPKLVDKLMGSILEFEEICTSLASSNQREFRLSARDSSEGDLSFLSRSAYFVCPFCRKPHPHQQEICPTTASPLESVHKLSGVILDEKYLLGEPLGMGAMSVVYRATHLLIKRELAVKLLIPEVAKNRENITRFFNEARISSVVSHPNLVEITDLGWTSEGLPYFTMELLDGVSLYTLISRFAPMEPGLALPIAIEILKTMQAVHSKGIVHRDLKPENIFLIRHQEGAGLKIMDFGVSRLIAQQEDESRLTQPGLIFGTPRYMSPEQAQGAETIDGRSDLFALGAILYEMLTGHQAFLGGYPGVLISICQGKFSPPRTLVPHLSLKLERAIIKALQVDPICRFQDAREFIDTLLDLAEQDTAIVAEKIPLEWKSFS